MRGLTNFFHSQGHHARMHSQTVFRASCAFKNSVRSRNLIASRFLDKCKMLNSINSARGILNVSRRRFGHCGLRGDEDATKNGNALDFDSGKPAGKYGGDANGVSKHVSGVASSAAESNHFWNLCQRSLWPSRFLFILACSDASRTDDAAHFE